MVPRDLIVVAVLCSSGCNALFGLDAPVLVDAGVADDYIADTMFDARSCVGDGLLNVCVPANATPVLQLTGTFNTTSEPRCSEMYIEHCVVIAARIEIPANVVATGVRPLVLVARERVVIAGLLDVGSRRIGVNFDVEQVGAGAAIAPCSGGVNGGNDPKGGGGGGGGSFGGSGGFGGRGNMGTGGTRGDPPPVSNAVAISGGCAGTRGGNGSAANSGGQPGKGGGAVYVIAGVAIELSGTILAGGMGGYGGDPLGGGGGGGSGGFIGLDAPSIMSTGFISANGGGGAEGGGSNNTGGRGVSATDPTTPAQGGAAGTNGGNGGDGSFGTVANGAAGSESGGLDAGGGGGGGGAGMVRIYPPQTVGGSISPPAT